MADRRLDQHIASTYRNLRFGLASIGIALPLLLYAIGRWWYGIKLQSSMSAYYFAQEDPQLWSIRSWLASQDAWIIQFFLGVLEQLDSEAPMRSWFVGLLFVLGVLLYLYKGFSWQENWLLNVAGALALGIALFPTQRKDCDPCRLITVHGIVAVSAFVCISIVSIFFSKTTLPDLPELDAEMQQRRDHYYAAGTLMPISRRIARLIRWIIDRLVPVVVGLRAALSVKETFPNQPRRQRYRNRYIVTGSLMFIFPFIAWLITTLLSRQRQLIFFVEWFGLWIFTAYWLIKSEELEDSQAEIRAIEKTAELPPAPTAGATDRPPPNTTISSDPVT